MPDFDVFVRHGDPNPYEEPGFTVTASDIHQVVEHLASDPIEDPDGDIIEIIIRLSGED